MRGEAREHHLTMVDGRALSPSDRRRIYQKLHMAALEGDWKTAQSYYSKYGPEISCNTKITNRNETVLHIAVKSCKVEFVKHAVNMMSDADLDVQDDAGNTAFFLSVIARKVNCFLAMMERKQDLAITRGVNSELPLYVAASRGYNEIVQGLYDATKPYWEYDDKINIFIALIYSNIYDVALDMLKEDKTLALAQNANNETSLHVLARQRSSTAYISSPIEQTDTITWKNFIIQILLLCVRKVMIYFELHEMKSIMREKAFELMKDIWVIVMQLDDSEIIPKLSPLMFAAVEKGNAEFLTILLHSYPNLMLHVDDNGYTIFHVAIMHRQEDIFISIQNLCPITEKISMYGDNEGNNMLHLAAKLPLITSRLQVVPGAAIQLQRELIWFEEVKKVVPLICLEAKNKKHQTPEDLFMESHQEMLKEGEKWMKGTANKCILVATLIATMVFEAVLKVPTQNEDAGSQLSVALAFFFVADAVSLVSSVASVMIFLGIITSRYQLYDFYQSLPYKLAVGLMTLFFSLVAMLVAYGLATLQVFYHSPRFVWYGCLLIAIGFTPVIAFIRMQIRLFMSVYVQTFLSDFIFMRNKLLYKIFN